MTTKMIITVVTTGSQMNTHADIWCNHGYLKTSDKQTVAKGLERREWTGDKDV